MEHLTDKGNATERQSFAQTRTILIAGATGNLGQRIVTYLLKEGATVKALVRKNSNTFSVATLKKQGVVVAEVDFNNQRELLAACTGASCLVSALNGLEDVIVDVQTQLLQSAIQAGVPRFIPSDYCIDYTKLPYTSNRNLDLRRKFSERLDKAPISATSILNGMFTDLLTGEAPVVLFGLKLVVYWGDKKQLLDFTTIDNTAAYTAYAALDDKAPRYLRVAGDELNAKGLQVAATKATSDAFKLLRAGGLNSLKTMIKITRTLMPKKNEVFPPWQGMQYLHNMLSGLPKLAPLDNERYPAIKWTTVQEVLAKREK